MAFPPSKVRLPPAVEEMLESICREQFLSPPDHFVRSRLCSLGEERSLDLLRDISSVRIRNLGVLIDKMANCIEGNNQSACAVTRRLAPATSCMHYAKRLRTQMESALMRALGEFEFRRLFLVLSYIGNKRLEDFLTMELIKELEDLPMSMFEMKLWQAVGMRCLSAEERKKNFDWESDHTNVYYCYVDPDGKTTFKGPYMHKTRTHLQRVLGDDHVLNVRFASEAVGRNGSIDNLNQRYPSFFKIAKEGITVGLRIYRFFVFKDGGKEEKRKNPASSSVKCYFVCTESTAAIDEGKDYILFGKSLHEVRCMFMHVHTVANIAKYMARFSLVLSKTIKLEVDLDSVRIEEITDIPCLDDEGKVVYDDEGEPLIHTDGTGFISEDLAKLCPMNISRGSYMNHGNFKSMHGCAVFDEFSSVKQNKFLIREPPLLIQCRLFCHGCAVKGTLLLNKHLPSRTIQVRPSMIKVKKDPKVSSIPSINSLEVVNTSNLPKKNRLSKHLIALLNYGGVPKEYFMELLNEALDEAQNIHSSKKAALKVAEKYGGMDDFLALRMIACGIPLEEPCLRHRLSVMIKEEQKSLKEGKLPVNECYYLMGTVDPTGTLNASEVCVILQDGQISGNILVFKHPGLHFGDIHILTATYVEELVDFVGNSKYAIFFPAKGPRSLADEMANSDFDGDMYWISRNPQLLQYFTASKPWERSSKKKMSIPSHFQYSNNELEDELFKQFLINRFHSSSVAGIAADSWLAYMDRLLTLGDECAEEKRSLKEMMLRIIDVYYDALDAPKSGIKVDFPQELKPEKFPHFMERSNSYCSTSILGLIYDRVHSFDPMHLPSEEVCQLPCFSDKVPDDCLKKWKNHYSNYRSEMTDVMSLDDESKDTAAQKVYEKYKLILYHAEEFEESPRKKEDIFNESLAIYQICYDYAKSNGVRKCRFAWMIAGHALCSFYSARQNEVTIPFSQSLMREMLG